MQIKNNHSNFIHKPWIIISAKIIVLLGCVYLITSKIQGQAITEGFVQPDGFVITIACILILMIFNWYLEALRWRISIATFESISTLKAIRVILGGLALNWILPFATGDLLARISQQKDKYQTTSAAVLNRGIMMVVTIIGGVYGSSFIAQEYQLKGWFALIFLILILVAFLLRKRLIKFLLFFQKLSRRIILQIIGISILRYAVFSLQFFLMLSIFLGDTVSEELIFGGVGWIFLARSSLPLFFGGIGVREASGIIFFDPHVEDLQLVLIPVFLIWIINSVLPSILGLIFILKSKHTIQA
ncbi:hypothetical protein [Ekhidna sp.]